MFVSSDLSVSRSAKGSDVIISYKGKLAIVPPVAPDYNEAVNLYNALRCTPRIDRENAITDGRITLPSWLTGEQAEAVAKVVEAAEELPVDKKAQLLEGLNGLLKFFTEFDFVPSFRFTNTLAQKVVKSQAEAKNYINHYFALTGSSFANDVEQKIRSKEFTELLKKIKEYGAPAQEINNRFKVYYGSAGTGKTTLAQSETDNRCIVCNSSMLPADLMENFIFKDGKPDFNPSMLWECMEQGKPIVLDEINLLPFDSLRFLQGIVDGKKSFFYKNREVHINDGFEIIGTMNLTLGGVTYGLPEPLVDRCEDIREFVLSAEQLAGAITGEFVAG